MAIVTVTVDIVTVAIVILNDSVLWCIMCGRNSNVHTEEYHGQLVILFMHKTILHQLVNPLYIYCSSSF